MVDRNFKNGKLLSIINFWYILDFDELIIIFFVEINIVVITAWNNHFIVSIHYKKRNHISMRCIHSLKIFSVHAIEDFYFSFDVSNQEFPILFESFKNSDLVLMVSKNTPNNFYCPSIFCIDVSNVVLGCNHKNFMGRVEFHL